VRIIRGIYKSRRFTPPKSFPSRPTTDFAKEGIFNVLENQYSLINLSVLDLCAGTGNISLEILSREAGKVISVDKHPISVRYMHQLKKELEVGEEWTIVKNDVLNYLAKCSDTFDIIFADPPYDMTFHAEIVKLAREKKMLKKDGLCIIEHGKQTNLSNELGYLNTRNFGNVYFSFFQF
jgi:16S rRNA (guanine(966)-N(2))-methyltransferase RsmD